MPLSEGGQKKNPIGKNSAENLGRTCSQSRKGTLSASIFVSNIEPNVCLMKVLYTMSDSSSLIGTLSDTPSTRVNIEKDVKGSWHVMCNVLLLLKKHVSPAD